MSLLKTIETIGQDILKGIEIAEPIIGTFEPTVGTILTDIAEVIATLEAKATPVTPMQMAGIVQAMSMTAAVKQASAVPKT